MLGDWQTTVHAFVTATFGVILLSAGLFGYLLRSAAMWERALLVAAAVLLIKPGWITDLAGFGLFAVVAGGQWVALRRGASRPAQSQRTPGGPPRPCGW